MWLDLIPESIPPSLRAQPCVLWRAEPRGGDPKPAKVPYQIAEPTRRASSTNPETWGTFADAVDAFAFLAGRHRDPDPALGPLAGVGVILTAQAGITCLDLDRVLEGDRLAPSAARLVERVQSWTERSPSGSGLHIFMHATLTTAVKRPEAKLELYDRARYIAVTGHRWPNTPADLQPRHALIRELVAILTKPSTPRTRYTGPAMPPPDDLGGALLAKVRDWNLETIGPLKRWSDGFLIELRRCPWSEEHTTGLGGSAVLIRASGAHDFTCLHSHCAHRTWRDLRSRMESPR